MSRSELGVWVSSVCVCLCVHGAVWCCVGQASAGLSWADLSSVVWYGLGFVGSI